MSQAIQIGGGSQKPSNNKPLVPQSLPANFYRGYIPPKTPKINPIPEPQPIGDDFVLPPSSQDNAIGINLSKGSYSLNNNKHPMSMPVHSGFIMGGAKNRLKIYSDMKNKHPAIPEIKEDDGTDDIASGVSNIKMQVGSFTAFQIMGGDNQSMSSFGDQDDLGDSDLNTSINDNSNNNNNNDNSNNNKNPSNNNNNDSNNTGDSLQSAQNDNNDVDDGAFDMDDDDAQFDMDDE